MHGTCTASEDSRASYRGFAGRSFPCSNVQDFVFSYHLNPTIFSSLQLLFRLTKNAVWLRIACAGGPLMLQEDASRTEHLDFAGICRLLVLEHDAFKEYL